MTNEFFNQDFNKIDVENAFQSHMLGHRIQSGDNTPPPSSRLALVLSVVYLMPIVDAPLPSQYPASAIDVCNSSISLDKKNQSMKDVNTDQVVV